MNQRMKFFRFLVGISTLPILLLIRVNMGYNLIGPWHNKPFGVGAGKYSTTWYGRIWFMLLTTLWILGFAILGFFEASFEKPDFVIGDPDLFFNHGTKLLLMGNIAGFFQFAISFLGETAITYFASFLFLYGLMFPILCIAYILSIDRAHYNNERLNPTSLGDSLLFGWFIGDNPDAKHALMSVIEPLFFMAIAAVFILNQSLIPFLFFGLAGLGLFVQGQQKRMNYRRALDEINANLDKGKAIINKEHSIKQSGNPTGTIQGKQSPESGAQPL